MISTVVNDIEHMESTAYNGVGVIKVYLQPGATISDGMAMNRVKIGLSTIRGASVPFPAGGKTRVVAIDIDLAALKAKNLAPQGVVNAFNAQNFILPSGTVIQVKDVAQVHDGYQPQQNVVRLDGVCGVLLTVLKSGAASTLSVVDGVKKAMPLILHELPHELDIKELADQSLFVRAAINSIIKEGVIVALLTAVMILLFLGS
jgi:multidrug efflux pump subunit AcrB